MRDTRLIMGMPITVEIVDDAPFRLMDDVYDFFISIDNRFSPYKPDSELSEYNRGDIATAGLSAEMLEVLALADRTRTETNGYFNLKRPDGLLDPSGIVKGWAVRKAARMIRAFGIQNFYVDAGGDIQTGGTNGNGEEWIVGIRNPFCKHEIIKAVMVRECGIATSGTYVRGQHIYNPYLPKKQIDDIVSLTIIGPDVLEADRFATAAFAMGEEGIYFIEELRGIEGYIINSSGVATQTSGFGEFVVS
jgi:thiamine biosynthesis lipoprotein